MFPEFVTSTGAKFWLRFCLSVPVLVIVKSPSSRSSGTRKGKPAANLWSTHCSGPCADLLCGVLWIRRKKPPKIRKKNKFPGTKFLGTFGPPPTEKTEKIGKIKGTLVRKVPGNLRSQEFVFFSCAFFFAPYWRRQFQPSRVLELFFCEVNFMVCRLFLPRKATCTKLTSKLSCTRLRVPPVALHVSRYTCRSWFPGFLKRFAGVAPVSRYTPKNFGVAPPPPCAGRCRTEIWLSEKVLRYTGLSQLQLRVSRYTVQN